MVTDQRRARCRHRLSTTAGRAEVGIDHAYALASYAVQGSTRSVSTSRVTPPPPGPETYVVMTRGRDENHLYLTAARDPLDGEARRRRVGIGENHRGGALGADARDVIETGAEDLLAARARELTG